MIYLVYKPRESTIENHAGMKHLCEYIAARYENVRAIDVFRGHRFIKRLLNKVGRLLNINGAIDRKSYPSLDELVFNYVYGIIYALKSNPGDHIVMVEYFCPNTAQYYFARNIRRFRVHDVKISGVAHYVPSRLETLFPHDIHSGYLSIDEWCRQLDGLVTLGSSLTRYFVEARNVNPSLVYTSWHYVDNHFYTPGNYNRDDHRLVVIAMGNMERDFDRLFRIVCACPNIVFHICAGEKMKAIHLFSSVKNCQVHGYMPEPELKRLMQCSDVSISVMNDTIGSNVITTSMAAGLAQVVSDVGSIRDYLDESCAIFCKNEHDFVMALGHLSSNRPQLAEMKQRSMEKATLFSIDRFYNELEIICR